MDACAVPILNRGWEGYGDDTFDRFFGVRCNGVLFLPFSTSCQLVPKLWKSREPVYKKWALTLPEQCSTFYGQERFTHGALRMAAGTDCFLLYLVLGFQALSAWRPHVARNGLQRQQLEYSPVCEAIYVGFHKMSELLEAHENKFYLSTDHTLYNTFFVCGQFGHEQSGSPTVSVSADTDVLC